MTFESLSVGLNFLKASPKEFAALVVAPVPETLEVPFLTEVLAAPTILLLTLSTVQILRLGVTGFNSSLPASLERLVVSAAESTTSSPDFTEVDESAGLPSSLPVSPVDNAEYELGNEGFLISGEVLSVESVSFNPSGVLGTVVQPLGEVFGSAGMTGVVCALDLVDLFPPRGLSTVSGKFFFSTFAFCNFSEEETDGLVDETSERLVEGVTGTDGCVSTFGPAASSVCFRATSRVLLFPFEDLGGQGALGSDSTIQGTGGQKVGNRCPARGMNGGLLGVVVVGRSGGVIAGANSIVGGVSADERLSEVILTSAEGVTSGVVFDERVGGRGDSWTVDTEGVLGAGLGLPTAVSATGVGEGSAADEAATGGDFM